uniref:Uncharacterized protein n=1 Tax=Glossina palpalis gambiensis TaxID=67801 RepID=A0A1B0BM01_9MUSC
MHKEQHSHVKMMKAKEEKKPHKVQDQWSFVSIFPSRQLRLNINVRQAHDGQLRPRIVKTVSDCHNGIMDPHYIQISESTAHNQNLTEANSPATREAVYFVITRPSSLSSDGIKPSADSSAESVVESVSPAIFATAFERIVFNLRFRRIALPGSATNDKYLGIIFIKFEALNMLAPDVKAASAGFIIVFGGKELIAAPSCVFFIGLGKFVLLPPALPTVCCHWKLVNGVPAEAMVCNEYFVDLMEGSSINTS